MQQIKNILLYLEDLDSAALTRAVEIASSAGAKLTLGAVVKPARSQVLFARSNFDLDEVERLLVDDRQRRLEELADTIRSSGIEIATRVFVGDPTDAIIRAVRNEDFDFLAKSPTPAKGLRRHLFGCIDMRLMRACPCPIFIGRDKATGSSRRVVAAVHDDEGSETKAELNSAILDAVAFVLGSNSGEANEVHIIHAWSLYGEALLSSGRKKLPADRFQATLAHEEEKRRQWLDKMVDNYRRSLDPITAEKFNPIVSLLHGEPQEVVPQQVQQLDADMLALGTVSRSGMSGLLIGNTAEAILNRVDCSVITLKPQGFVSMVSSA